jgi:hypothetical protein
MSETSPTQQQVVATSAALLAPSATALAQTEKTRRTLEQKWQAGVPDIVAIIICAIAGLVIVGVAGAANSVGLTFRNDLSSTLPSVLSTLLIVSLFVERVIEVFISVWSDRETDEHEQNRDYWQSRQAKLKDDIATLLSERNGTPAPSEERKVAIDTLLKAKREGIELANDNADVESKALIPFEARTRRISSWIGLAVGILVAGVGFRFLNQIVSLGSIYDAGNNSHSPQYGWFVVADVLLTGAVLAGGSKAIHQIFSVYDAFMKTSQDRLSDKSGAK